MKNTNVLFTGRTNKPLTVKKEGKKGGRKGGMKEKSEGGKGNNFLHRFALLILFFGWVGTTDKHNSCYYH